MKILFRTALAATAFASSPLLAQAADVAAASEFPTCAEAGQLRVVVSVPPGLTQEETAARIRESRMFVEGTQVVYIPTGRLPRMLNEAEFRERFDLLMEGMLRENRAVDGSMSIMLQVNADGVVEQVTPNTGNRLLDRRLQRVWMPVRFEPMVLGGCRARGFLQTPLSFSSNYALDWSEIQAKPTIEP
ncbi:MAG TPA: hypothetical protein VF665_24150 [Longimicrobium sp.]|jgi:hypothetical protein|uniref:hypothetical protein n=1 Tax=Longimicrobium sp. TaxID=2029185 RepID=UPI002EDA0E62